MEWKFQQTKNMYTRKENSHKDKDEVEVSY
jgi:hypothetical protein